MIELTRISFVHGNRLHSPFTKLSGTTLLVLLLLIVFSGCTDTVTELPEKPNIVLFFADDLGYGDLSSYGHPTIRTPRLDSLARQGMRFMSFYNAAASCSPARAALLTGRYPQRAGVPGVLMPGSENGLSAEERTIATLLGENGYRTKAIGKWHLGHNREEFMPTSHGFDEYFGLLYSNDMIRPWVETDRPLRLYRNLEALPGEVDQSRLTVRYTEEAVNFVRKAADEPFFLYLPYTMPHVPIYAPEERRGQSLAGTYGDVIETIDWSVGEVLDALEEAGIDGNTLVIFTSDNGPWSEMPDRMFSEELMEGHHVIRPWHAGTSGLLRGSKGSSWEGGFRVPAIIRWPGQVPADAVSSDIVTTMDLFATLSHVGGAPLPEDRTIDGNNVIDHLRGRASSPTETLYYYRGTELQAVRNGAWKLVVTGPDQPELYHLEHDPGERYDRAAQERDRVRQLLEMMENFDRQIHDW